MIGVDTSVEMIQKTALLGSARILGKAMELLNKHWAPLGHLLLLVAWDQIIGHNWGRGKLYKMIMIIIKEGLTNSGLSFASFCLSSGQNCNDNVDVV